eukprot:scaffold215858_cov20-Tisochrysis_lutea.AAC.1
MGHRRVTFGEEAVADCVEEQEKEVCTTARERPSMLWERARPVQGRHTVVRQIKKSSFSMRGRKQLIGVQPAAQEYQMHCMRGLGLCKAGHTIVRQIKGAPSEHVGR